MKYKKTFVAILLLALFLRIFLIDKVPYGFSVDEASSAYDAYSVLLTGKDRHAEILPLLFRSFDDYIPPMLNYGIMVSEFLFGLNIFAARLVPAVFGLLTVVVCFYLVKRLFNERIALIAALFLAISPWHLQYSRIDFPAATLPFFFLSGLWLFFLGLEKRKFLVLSAIPFALTFYTYAISKLFIPLFLVGLFFVFRKRLFDKLIIKPVISFLVLLLVFSLPAIYSTFFDDAQKRFNDISIFRDEQESVLTALGYTKIEAPYKIFLRSYFNYFSLNFLFVEGDKNTRHNIKNIGQLYWFDLPFVLAGLIVCLWRRNNVHQLLIWWLIIYPVAASLTHGPLHATRTIDAIPLFQILSAYGLYWLYIFFKDKGIFKLILSTIIILITINFSYYAYNYFILYPKYSRDAFEAEVGNVLVYAESVKDEYDEVDITYAMDRPYIYILFYNKFDPFEYQQYGLNRTKYKIDYIGFLYNESKNALYIAKSFELKDKEEQKVFYYNDGSVAFRVI